jgi:hypothetical protein
LSPESIAHLTQLTVYLNHPGSNNAPPENASEDALSDWQSTAHITTHIRPSRLRMYFICDVGGLETAIYALKQFLNIPKLADCAIRLSRHLDPRLQDLAQSTAMQAMGHWQCSNHARSPFRFLDLPRELRFQILEYTDLVTPHCEVEWTPERNYYLRYNWVLPICVMPGLGCSYTPGCMCQFEKSWIEDPSNPMWQKRFCRRYQAAFSSRCHCWSPPTSLFLVCQLMQEDAQVVFFSKNRFVIVPSGGPTHPVGSTPARLEISIFLRETVPCKALQFLRSVEIVFPPFHDDYLRPHELGYQDWLQTIELMAEVLTLPLLTLRVFMADNIQYLGFKSDFRTSLTQDDGFTILEMYFRTLGCLSKLREKGLNRFLANLAWPWAHKSSVLRNPSRLLEQSTNLGKRLETYVIGDGYDVMAAMALQPWELRSSTWHENTMIEPCYDQ